MATPTKYTFSIANDVGGPVDADFLVLDLPRDGITTPLLRIDTDGDVLDIWFEDVLSGAEEAALDAVIAEHGVEAAQKLRYVAIDQRTFELIDAGYTFEGHQFSLSMAAQSTLLALDMTRNDPSLTYPIEFNTLYDDAEYMLDDATDVHNIFLTALGTYRYHRDAGTALKTAVRNCTTVAAVNAVVDDR